MRVAFVMNKPLRERNNFKKVIEQIALASPETECLLICLHDSDAILKLLSFAPDTVILFPLTAFDFPFLYYQLKIMLRARFLIFRTEGTFHEESQSNIDSHCSKMIQYGPRLADGEVFWGRAMQRVVGSSLVAQNKVSSTDRLFYTGYPEYEVFFEDVKIADEYRGYKKEDVILFLTGFYFANYTDENILAAKDLVDENAPDAERNFERMKQVRNKYRLLRRRWIHAIQKTAQDNPHKLLIVKHHPIEYESGVDDYLEQLGSIPNIELAPKSSVTNILMLSAGVVVQYGSTCLAAAYLAKAYTVFAFAEDLFDGEDEVTGLAPYEVNGFTSHAAVQLEKVADFLSSHKYDREQAMIPEKIQTRLHDTFNIKPGETYRPSHDFAQLILDPRKAAYQNVIFSKQDMEYFFNEARKHKRYGLTKIYKTVFKSKKLPLHLRLKYLERYFISLLFGYCRSNGRRRVKRRSDFFHGCQSRR